MESSEKWYAVKEVAGLYGWSVDTIRRLVRKGHIRAIVLPQQSGKRKRQYESMRIAGSELERMERLLQVKCPR
jgi:excisionase family DNA binding protein